MTTSVRLTKAFRALRRDGYFARKNWMCCQNCGVHEVPEEYENFVFYHAQDADTLKEADETYLAWRGDGNLIKQRCEEAGLHVVWDGTSGCWSVERGCTNASYSRRDYLQRPALHGEGRN